MAFQVSPGVEIKEIDLTNIIPAVSTTSTGFAGFFNWGPVGQRINISSDDAIYLYINDTIPNSSYTLSNIYSQSKDEDGFLYITYAGENAFGN